ncbi:hypothetical protein GXB85_05400 [Cellulomonas sp. APG4]|uniref:hypothetical protein n=1 Tax=Cellulomonas sp. APG4 TaxID=1538656 RepID=UPI00137B9356|nr:hypothetical protein [Cellulomonas sp. APG4]NCT90387.1 hypothetical protein [Cellulomonas sp. APG4]
MTPWRREAWETGAIPVGERREERCCSYQRERGEVLPTEEREGFTLGEGKGKRLQGGERLCLETERGEALSRREGRLHLGEREERLQPRERVERGMGRGFPMDAGREVEGG